MTLLTRFRRFFLVSALGLALGTALSLSHPVSAQTGPFSAQIQRAITAFKAAPVLNGQWTVNGVPCTTGQVVQGGAVTICNNAIFQPEPTPAAPTVALAGAGAGNVDNGTHVYAEGCVTPTGESIASATSNTVTVADNTMNGRVTVTLTYCSGAATGRNVYRSKAGTTTPLFRISASPMVGDAYATATYTDNTADASLTATVAPTSTATADARFTFNQTGGPLEQGGFCFNAARTSCLYYIASNIAAFEGRLFFTDTGFNSGRTNDNKSIFARIEDDSWGTGGVQFYGRNGSTPGNPAVALLGQVSNASSFPAVSLTANYLSNAATGTLTDFSYTGRLFEFCYTIGSHPCDVWRGSTTFVAGLDQNNTGYMEMLGSGQVFHRRWGTAQNTPIGATETSAWVWENPVAATNGAQVQFAPSTDWCGSAWNAASEYDCWRITNRPAAGNPTTSTWALRSAIAGGAFTDRVTVTSSGVMSGPTYQSSGSGMAVANVGANSCGTTAATIAGNNNAFVITVGATSGTQCRVTFTFTAPTEWDCAANDDTTTVAVRTTPVDTTHTDLIGAFTAGDKVTGICFPR